MLTLHPKHVVFAGQPWPRVSAIAIDRTPAREVVEWSDFGPHVVLADVPQQRIDITVVIDLTDEGGFEAPRPGQAGDLSFTTAPAAGDARRVQVSTQAVILGVTHDLSAKKATRTVRLIATSAAGGTDPITIT